MLDKLKDAGIKPEIFEIVYDKSKLEEKIKENRPKIFLIDGGLLDQILTGCLFIVQRAISNFDVSMRFFMFEENKPMPGVTFLDDLKNLKNYL